MDVHMWVTRLKFKAEFDIFNGDLWMKVNENKCPCNKKKKWWCSPFYGIHGYLNMLGFWIFNDGKWLCMEFAGMIIFQWEFMVLSSLSAWI